MANKINLFCLPYAGGSAVIYNKWKVYLNGSIQLIPLELAGRGTRFKEPPYQNFTEAINDIYLKIETKINDQPFAFFGHSMGCLLAYELSRKIVKNKSIMPIHLFFSGRLAPHFRYESISTLPEKDFIDKVMALGGISQDFLQNKEMQSVFFPIIKADYQMVESYQIPKTKEKFSCNISIFYGADDQMTFDNVSEWGQYTNGKCNLYRFPGGHFFIWDESAEIIQIINQALLPNNIVPITQNSGFGYNF